MKTYRAKGVEWVREGWTHLFIVQTADLTGFSNVQLTLTALAVGDVVRGATIDVKTVVTGPTANPTAQVKVNTANKAITPTCIVTSATVAGVTSDNSVLDAYLLPTGTDNLVLDLQVGGGNGAAATAGEIWVWVNISRQADRVNLAA